MKWCVAYIVGVAVAVFSATVFGFILPGLNSFAAWVSLCSGFCAGFFVVSRHKQLSFGIKVKELGFWSWAGLFCFVIFTFRAFLWVLYRKGNSLQILSPFNLGDLSLHILYIKYLASGVGFWPDNPMFSFGGIHYPFGMDLLNSLLYLTGMSVERGLVWVGLISSIVLLFALWGWGRAFSVAGFLFNGGLAGFVFFKKYLLSDFQEKLAWKSILLTLFVPQRGLLFAFPAGLLLLISWRERFFNGRPGVSHSREILPFWVEALIYFSLPLFHTHTFIFLSLFLSFWFVFSPGCRGHILRLWVVSVLPASFLVLFLTDFFKGGPSVHIRWGWEQGAQGFFNFWFLNLGILIPLALWLFFRSLFTLKNHKWELKASLDTSSAFVIPAVLLFLVFSNVMLSVWNWDNIKCLVWSYLILLPFLWKELISRWRLWIRYAACFVLFFSGFLLMARGLDGRHGYEIFKVSEVRGIESAVSQFPRTARFAICPKGHHPLLYCGRRVAIGYAPWVWSHGIALGDADKKLTRLMMGEPEWRELAAELKVKYIFWGPYEEKAYTSSRRPWAKNQNPVASGEWGKIYSI